MRVFLDEDLPLGFPKHLAPREARHASEMGWKGKSNGETLQAAIDTGFDVLLTGDAHLRYQQDLGSYDIAVIELRPPRLVLKRLLELLPELRTLIDSAPKRAVTSIPPRAR